MTQRSASDGAPDVLVVEADPAGLELTTDLLRGTGRVRSARTLTEALACCARHVPDCVVLDLDLPDVDGLGGLNAVLSAHPAVPVVVLAGAGDTALVQEALRAGAREYVHKDDRDLRLWHAVESAREQARGCRRLPGNAQPAEPDRQARAARPLAPCGRAPWQGSNASGSDPTTPPGGAGGNAGDLRLDQQVSMSDVDQTTAAAAPAQRSQAKPHGSVPDEAARHDEERDGQFEARILQAVGQPAIATDASARVRYWNDGAHALLGWSPAEAVGRLISEFITQADAGAGSSPDVLTALTAGLPWAGVSLARRRDGSTFSAMVTTRPLLDDAGAAGGVVSISTTSSDIAGDDLNARRLAAVLAATSDAVILTSPDGVIEYWNAAAEQIHGWGAQEALGRHVSMLSPRGSREPLETVMERLNAGETVRDLEVARLRRDGSTIEMSLTVSAVLDRTGRLIGVAYLARDSTARRAGQRALEQAAAHDDLTGLPNRTLLSDRLEQLVAGAQHAGTPLAVLFVDVDSFKDINEAGGHLLGDQVLVEVAARLKAALGPGDTVARFGSDEFVVLLPGTDDAGARALAGQLLTAVRKPMQVAGQRLLVSASIGVAVSPGVDPETLLRAADAAVYEAKARGRSQVRSFAGELSQRAQERLAMSSDLSNALTRDLLHLVYQPVMSLDTGTVIGLEALARWKHPEWGDIPPSTFVDVADRTGLARQLDEWVLRNSCLEFAELHGAGAVPPNAHLAVNVTAGNVLDPEFPGVVRAAVDAAALAPETLVLEVTEAGFMNDLDAGVRMLNRLRELGVRIAIDDFCTGWSSPAYLNQLPASIIKLDGSFVSRLQEDNDDLAIAASVIELGRATGMTVVAEGVETHEQLAILRRLGCVAGQGYLWHEAVPAGELAGALSSAAAVALTPPPTRQQRQSVERLIGQPSELGPEHGIERLWELHRDGASMTTIAAALNRDGYRTPAGQRWHSKTVAGALGQAALAATRTTLFQRPDR